MSRSPARPADARGDPQAAKNPLRIGLLLTAAGLTAAALVFSLRDRAEPNPFERLLADSSGDSFRSDSAQNLEHLERVTRAFFEASNADALLAVCRDPARIAPLMARHHRRQPLQPRAWQGLDWARPLREPGQNLFLTQSSIAGREPLQLVIELTARGFHADWESHVHYSEMEWQEFIAHRPTSPVLFRVFATLLDNPAESVRGRGRLEIQHPDHDAPLQAALNSEAVHWPELSRQLAQGAWKKVPLTLRLCYDGEIQDPSTVRIAAVEGKGWLVLNP